jgi:hypothetical protein
MATDGDFYLAIDSEARAIGQVEVVIVEVATAEGCDRLGHGCFSGACRVEGAIARRAIVASGTLAVAGHVERAASVLVRCVSAVAEDPVEHRRIRRLRRQRS